MELNVKYCQIQFLTLTAHKQSLSLQNQKNNREKNLADCSTHLIDKLLSLNSLEACKLLILPNSLSV